MRPKDVSKLLAATIAARLAVLVTGAPGVGKSDVVEQAAASAKNELIVSHPVVSDPTEAKGIPWPKEGGKVATFLPFEDLHAALTCKKPTTWFIDDIGQAAPATQASFMQLLLARRVNGKKLPDHLTFVAATNRRTDRAGVSGLLEPVKSRFLSIVSLEPNLDDWCNWALKSGVPAELIAFLRFRPELLHQFNPTLDLVNSPCPRTWANVGRIINLDLPEKLELTTMIGAVGEGPAAECQAFLRIWRNLPSLDAILADPTSAEIPDQPATLYAVSVGLAAKANQNNFSRIKTYADRMFEDGKGEFAVLTIRDCVRKNPSIQSTPTFIELASSKLGNLFTGEED